jgi:hypothetical protein
MNDVRLIAQALIGITSALYIVHYFVNKILDIFL